MKTCPDCGAEHHWSLPCTACLEKKPIAELHPVTLRLSNFMSNPGAYGFSRCRPPEFRDS